MRGAACRNSTLLPCQQRASRRRRPEQRAAARRARAAAPGCPGPGAPALGLGRLHYAAGGDVGALQALQLEAQPLARACGRQHARAVAQLERHLVGDLRPAGAGLG